MFRDMDKVSRQNIGNEFLVQPQWKKLTNKWKVPQAKKQRLMARKEELLEEYEASVEKDQRELITVHDPDMGVTLPVHPD